jgi:hypothetical protein
MSQSIFPLQGGSAAHAGKTRGLAGSHIVLTGKTEGLAKTSLANQAIVESRAAQTAIAQPLHIWCGVPDKGMLSGFGAMMLGRSRTLRPI